MSQSEIMTWSYPLTETQKKQLQVSAWCQSCYLILSRNINCPPLHTFISTPHHNFTVLSPVWVTSFHIKIRIFTGFLVGRPICTLTQLPRGDSARDSHNKQCRTFARVNHQNSSPAKISLCDFMVVIEMQRKIIKKIISASCDKESFHLSENKISSRGAHKS